MWLSVCQYAELHYSGDITDFKTKKISCNFVPRTLSSETYC